MTKFCGASDRNKDHILDVLKNQLDANQNGFALEISSGTGQHIVHFAQYFTKWKWQPSDVDQHYTNSVKAYLEETKLENILSPVFLDVTDNSTWNNIFTKQSIDLMFNSNMIHITPIECTYGLFKVAGDLLKSKGKLITYGPYSIDGVLQPQSNINFDKNLKSNNAAWGVRDTRLLAEHATKNDMKLIEIIDLPSNNKCIVFVKN